MGECKFCSYFYNISNRLTKETLNRWPLCFPRLLMCNATEDPLGLVEPLN